MSTSAILSLLSSSGNVALATNQATTQSSYTATTSSSSNNSSSAGSSDSSDPLTQDVVQLLKALASGDTSAANSSLSKVKADLGAQPSAQETNQNLANTTPLVQSQSTGKSDVTDILQNIQTQAATGARTLPASITSKQTVTSLDALVGKLTQSLSTGSTSTALQDVATYLVQNGQGKGNLLNTTA